jgi:hypothetical protein
MRPTVKFEKYAEGLTEGGTRVAFGPFKGLQLGKLSYYSSAYNKLLGIYERELHGVVECALKRKPSLVVDIGAAEGYYACGLAARCSESAKHVAFEADFRYRFELRRNLERNGLSDRVEVRGFCSPPELDALLTSRSGESLVVCDVEGLEVELLDPEIVPSVKRATLLVETHDMIVAGASEYLVRKLSPTHSVEKITAVPRTASDLASIGAPDQILRLPQSTIRHYLRERPDRQIWLFALPKA